VAHVSKVNEEADGVGSVGAKCL